MEDLGNILFYLVLAIVAIIGAVVNKKKKTAQKPAPESNKPYPEEDTIFTRKEEKASFPDIEEKEWAVTEDEMIDPGSLQTANSGIEDTSIQSSEDQALKMGAEFEGLYSEPLAEKFASEGISVTDVSITQSELGTESEFSRPGQNSWAKSLIEDFDLPKAIIYSEILNRKDFV
jgi:hypothetical protein